jgi:hypothetical protein
MKRGNRAAAQDAKKKDRLMKQQLRRARAIRTYGVRNRLFLLDSYEFLDLTLLAC